MSGSTRRPSRPIPKKAPAAAARPNVFRRLQAVPDRYLYPVLFCLLCLWMGPVAAFTIPPLQVPDEWVHMLRAVDTASGRCVAQPGSTYDGALLELAHTFRAPLENTTPLAQQKAAAYLKDPAQHAAMGREPMPAEKPSGDIYSCVPYLASAVPWLLSEPLGLANIPAFYAGRFANLFLYMTLTAAALWWMPVMRLVLLVVALLPMTLQQAASYSADSMALGLSFLFLALCLHFAFHVQVLRWRHWCALCAVAVPLTLSKFNIFLLLAAIIIPSASFAGRKRKAWALVLLLGLSFATAGAWQAVNHENAQRFAQFRESSGVHQHQNAAFLREEPLAAAVLVANSLAFWGKHYLVSMVFALGHLQYMPPGGWALSLLLLLLAAALLPDGNPRLGGFQRAVLLGAFVCSLVSMLLLIFVFEADTQRLADARAQNTVIVGVQGRYLLPIIPLLLLALPAIPERWRVWPKTLPPLVAVLLLLGINFQVFAFYRDVYANYQTYLVAAGPLDGKLVRTKDNPRLLFVVARGVRHMVRDDDWMRLYGLRQPEDVVDLQPAELLAIPQGDAISSYQAASGRALPLPWQTAPWRYEGRLIAPENDPRQIFLVEGGIRRPLSAEALGALPWRDEKCRVISMAEFLNLPLGGVVYPEQRLGDRQ